MTVNEILERVTIVRDYDEKGDTESAHVCEDGLLHDVLRAIAAGAAEPSLLAAAALAAVDPTVDRWYA